jgi:hypothetical protein
LTNFAYPPPQKYLTTSPKLKLPENSPNSRNNLTDSKINYHIIKIKTKSTSHLNGLYFFNLANYIKTRKFNPYKRTLMKVVCYQTRFLIKITEEVSSMKKQSKFAVLTLASALILSAPLALTAEASSNGKSSYEHQVKVKSEHGKKVQEAKKQEDKKSKVTKDKKKDSKKYGSKSKPSKEKVAVDKAKVDLKAKLVLTKAAVAELEAAGKAAYVTYSKLPATTDAEKKAKVAIGEKLKKVAVKGYVVNKEVKNIESALVRAKTLNDIKNVATKIAKADKALATIKVELTALVKQMDSMNPIIIVEPQPTEPTIPVQPTEPVEAPTEATL